MVKDVAQYRVEAGSRILVTPESFASPDEVRLWLLGSCLGVLMHQRGALPLHASAAVIHGKAIAFCGDSGEGKSVLAAALRQHGLDLLTDYVSLAIHVKNIFRLYPGFPRIKLCQDAIEHFNFINKPMKKLRRRRRFGGPLGSVLVRRHWKPVVRLTAYLRRGS